MAEQEYEALEIAWQGPGGDQEDADDSPAAQ
jgi:hypothetical protein